MNINHPGRIGLRQKIRTLFIAMLIAFGHQVKAQEILPFAGEWIGKNNHGKEVTVAFSGNTVTSYQKQEPVLIAGELHQIKPYIKKVENVTFYQALGKGKYNQFAGYLPSEKEIIRFEIKSNGQLIVYGNRGDKVNMLLNRKE